jgi:hypothetical protein
MDKTNRIIKITRRMTEIEELRANRDLPQLVDEELAYEYDDLEQELSDIEPAQ